MRELKGYSEKVFFRGRRLASATPPCVIVTPPFSSPNTPTILTANERYSSWSAIGAYKLVESYIVTRKGGTEVKGRTPERSGSEKKHNQPDGSGFHRLCNKYIDAHHGEHLRRRIITPKRLGKKLSMTNSNPAIRMLREYACIFPHQPTPAQTNNVHTKR